MVFTPQKVCLSGSKYLRAVGRMLLRYLLDAVFVVFTPQEVCLSGSKYLPCCGTDVITVFAGCCFCGIRSTGSMPLRLQIPAVLWDGCYYGICWMLFLRYSLHRKYASQAPNTCRAVGRMSLRYLLDAVFAVFAPQEVCLSGSKYLPCCGTDVITVFAGCCFCGIHSTGSMPLRLQIPAVLWDGCYYGICWMLFLWFYIVLICGEYIILAFQLV